MTRPSTAAPILAVLAVMLVTLGAYVGGYFWLGERFEVLHGDGFDPAETTILRIYPQEWMATLYRPAGWIEEKLRSVDVDVWWLQPDRIG